MTHAELVERVARAIYEARNGAGAVKWTLRGGAHKAPYLADARAALAAVAATVCFDALDVEYVAAGIEAHADTYGVAWLSQQRRFRDVAALLRALAEDAERHA